MKLLAPETVRDPSFRELRSQVIVSPAEIPDLVLTRSLRDYVWLEFETVLQDEFWDLLAKCASDFGDRRIYVQCDDEFVAENYGHAGVAEFAVEDPPPAYRRFLDLHDLNEPSTTSLRHFADRLLFWGDSGHWGFVGSRSVELVVGGHASDGGWPLIKGVRFHTFDTVLELASGPYRKQLPTVQVAKYEEIYRERSWQIATPQEGT